MAASVSNIPELSVSELSFALKRTLEDTYGRVRVRGELSRVKIHSSGHLYSDLKDSEAVLNLVCWKGTVARLPLRPEEGLEVICTGKISSYPGRSNYQLIVDSMELAGQGALLKMLDDRRHRLAAEGLFAADRKRPLPYLPDVIGVVTSPTGAVIRDIMHRLDDRFPRRVLLWPVAVQGPGAAAQVAAAIAGFDALPPGGKIPRPDVLIVARGGGSLEDLMAFNEEEVVRAAASCRIPLIAAVGHETDTTLIDFAADIRAPTPTAAAEMAVPVRAELLGWTDDAARRMRAGLSRQSGELTTRLAAQAARLGDPGRLLALRIQTADNVSHRLDTIFRRGLERRETQLAGTGARLRHPRDRLREAEIRLAAPAQSLDRAMRASLRLARTTFDNVAGKLLAPEGRLRAAEARLEDLESELSGLSNAQVPFREKRLDDVVRLLEILSYKNVLARGFAVVRGADKKVLSRAADVTGKQVVTVELQDGALRATLDGKRLKTV